MMVTEPQQDGTNPRKKLYSALVGNANPEAKSHFKKFSFEQFNKRLDDEKFVEELYQSLRDNDVVLDPKNRQPEQNYYDFLDAYVKVPAAKPIVSPTPKPSTAEVPPPAPTTQQAAVSQEPLQVPAIPSFVEIGGSKVYPDDLDLLRTRGPEKQEEEEFVAKNPPTVEVFPTDEQLSDAELYDYYGEGYIKPRSKEWYKIVLSNPQIGTPEYDLKQELLKREEDSKRLAMAQQIIGEKPIAENEEQFRQNLLSPVFKGYEQAKQFAEGGLEPYTQKEEARKTKAFNEYYSKLTPQQRAEMARTPETIRLQEEENRTVLGKLADLGSAIGATFDNMYDKILAAEALLGAKQKKLFTFGETNKKAQEEEKRIKKKITRQLEEVNRKYSNRMYEYNIQGNVYDALKKGEISKLPEALTFNIAQIGMQALGASYTGGYSMFSQMLPEMYKAGVDEIAEKTNQTPDQVIEKGEDAEVVAYLAALANGYVEKVSSGILGQAMKSQGGHKFIRDFVLKKLGKSKLARTAATGAAITGVGTLEGGVEAGQKLIEIAQRQAAAAKSPQEAISNTINELRKKGVREEVVSEFVNAFFGTAGLGGGSQAIQSAMDRTLFETPKISKATQRADYDVIQTDNKITERNKIAQAMEKAVEGNPEAEGQIRQQYQKRINEAAPTDQEVLSAYESLSTLAETEEKNAIRENLERYMEQKGIKPPAAPVAAPEAVTAEEVQGTGRRVVVDSIEEAPTEEAPAAPVAQFQPPTLKLSTPQGFAPYLRKLGYTDEEISNMTIEQQQEIAINKIEPARAEGSAKVDAVKENQRLERVAEAQRKLDEEIAAEEAATTTEEPVVEAAPVEEFPAAPKEVGVGGVVRGYENIVGNKGLGDVRDELPWREMSGTVVVEGKDGGTYAVAFSRKGGDGEYILEQGASTPRPGPIYTSVKIDTPSNAQEVEAATKQAEEALGRILPTVKGGNIDKGAVQQALEAKPEPAPAVTPTAETKKEEAPKPQPKKEEAPKEEKPSATTAAATPEIGTQVELPPQIQGGSPRKMVFTKDGWMQSVGGENVLVGEGVQKQAQEAYEKKQAPSPQFTSSQSSEAATAFDKAKTSKGFDSKHGKGAYKTLSQITKDFENIMDKVSEKIKQDC